MFSVTWSCLIMAAAAATAIVIPRFNARRGDAGPIRFQFIFMATVAFVSLCVLADATHGLADVLSLTGLLTAFAVCSSIDSGRILLLSSRRKFRMA